MTRIDQRLAEREEEIDLLALLYTALRYKYFIASVTAVFVLAAVVYALTATRYYRAEVVVTDVTDRNMSGNLGGLASQFGGLASLAGMNLGQNSIGREARAVLQSRGLVQEFVRRNDLMGALFPTAKEQPTLWQGVSKFQNSILDIREDVRKGVTTVAIEWTDPSIAARWANDFVALANEIIRTRALEESKRNIKYLNEQIALTNVVELRRVMYSLIEGETKTLMLANGRTEYAFTVVDPAVPPELRVRPRRTMIVFLAAIAGLLVGTLAALVRGMRSQSSGKRELASVS